MLPEENLRLRNRIFQLRLEFSAPAYLDLLRDIAAASGWDLLVAAEEALPLGLGLEEQDVHALCDLIRHCVPEGTMPPSAAASNSSLQVDAAKERDDHGPLGALADSIHAGMEAQFAVAAACRKDGQLWPFVDAYMLDGSLKSIFDGVNPFTHLAEVLRSYFVPTPPKQTLICPMVFWVQLEVLLSRWTARSNIESCDRSLLLLAVRQYLGASDSLGVDAMLSFWGSSTRVANTYLAHCPDLENEEPVLRLFLLLFDIGREGQTLVPRLAAGETDSLAQRLVRLFPLPDAEALYLSLPPELREIIGKAGYTPKTIEVEHFERLMPRPYDGDEAGAEAFNTIAEPLAQLVKQLSSCWPGSIEALHDLAITLETQYPADLYDTDPTVGLEAAMMAFGNSCAGIGYTWGEERRTAFGLKIVELLRKDGWISASHDFLGFLILLYSFVPSDLSLGERRSFSEYFDKHPAVLRSEVVATALAQMAADRKSSVNTLWARQYSSYRADRQLRIARSREELTSRDAFAQSVAAEFGEERWLRLQERTRELLLTAEIDWRGALSQMSGRKEWGIAASAFFVPMEHELRHWFAFLGEDPFREMCSKLNIRMEKDHLTAGPIINALKRLPQLPKEISDAVEEKGFDASRLVPLMKKMSDALYLRNRGFHGHQFDLVTMAKMREELLGGQGLLQEFAECLPRPAN